MTDDPWILMTPLVLVLVMVPAAVWVTAPVPVMVMFPVVELFVMAPAMLMVVPVHVIEPPAVVAFVTAALNVIPALALTVRELALAVFQLMGLLTVTVPVFAFPEAVEMVTLQLERFVISCEICTVAVAGAPERT